MTRRFALLIALVVASRLPAQVVRGRVTERTSQEPIAGALIELLTNDAMPRRVGATLTAADGAYAISAPGPGTYVVSAKRIGVRRSQSTVTVSAGETIRSDLVLDAVLYTLPEVTITAPTSCATRDSRGQRVAALWEDARTALLATQVSLREERFRARVTRYVRELDPRTLRVVEQTTSSVSGVVSRPFTAVDGDSVSRHGYWIPRADGGVTYHGPDADILTSDAFLHDHCFHEVSGGRDRRGLVGLGFRPLPTRTTVDVVGTLWLDQRTFELRLVEFHYSRVQPGVDSTKVGGELQFTRLGNGAWTVSRWSIRLPVFARPASPVTTGVTEAPWVLVRPTMLSLREEGGTLSGVVPR